MDNRETLKQKDPNINYDFFLKLLGEYIKSERLKAGFKNANTFANLIDIAESQYREYERGETDMQLSSFIKIFKGLNKRIEDVFNLPLPGLEINVIARLIANPSIMETQVRNQVELSNGNSFQKALSSEDIVRIISILLFCFTPQRKQHVLSHLKLSAKTANFVKIWKLLLANNWLAMQHSENPNIPAQKYYTTTSGKNVVQLK